MLREYGVSVDIEDKREGGVTVDVALEPGGDYFAALVEQANIADPQNSHDNVTLTMAALGANNNQGASLGRGGYMIVDMGASALLVDLPGDDVTVHESNEDFTNEGFDLYGGPSYLGPWTLIGTGNGTTSFDLAGTGLDDVRFVRIDDDGDGSASGPYPGFELDAIESLHAGTTTGIAGDPRGASPAITLTLAAPGPNPVGAGETQEIAYTVPGGAPATVRLYDVSGRLVRTLLDRESGAVDRTLRWSARDAAGRPLAAGVYLLRLSTPEAAASKKVLVGP
jgi:hypothetical protein